MTTATMDAPAAEAPAGIVRHRRLVAPIALGAIGLLSLIVFGFGTQGGLETTFAIARPTDFVDIPDFAVPSQATAIILSLVALGLAGLSFWFAWAHRPVPLWLYSAFALAVIFAMLTWVGAGKGSTSMQITGLLIGSVFLAVPLVFGALAGTLCERSGIINIAIEGQLLAGAFLAAVVAGGVASASGSRALGAYMGLIAAPIAGALVGAALALFAVKYWVNQIVVGVVLNVLVVGVTNFLFGTLLKENPDLNQAIGLPRLPIPLLHQIPIIGPVLFNSNMVVYLMYIIVIVMNIMLFKSRWGLRVRAVGEHPRAADTVGIKVNRTRVRNTILGGAIAGLGGAFFTVANGLAFGKEMTGGKGFIALAAMILGRWSPKGALAAGLLFGFADALREQFGIVGSSIPSQFLAMLPYLATIFAVAGLVGHVRPPAAEGIPYKK
ncbi:ABC transporter permease [Demequina mangrovi]|uniref:Nucleoside ABC transporter membrane protein n=1 Tax=Demequina mangrovi TaxID=1043493 RepID=A0A1H6XX04_9MICO|nr:ABC transporter permease [Demequina mangrovi]SEJ33583.1 nucleoside ABC transporter membrane protein [Demequina mangrovi]